MEHGEIRSLSKIYSRCTYASTNQRKEKTMKRKNISEENLIQYLTEILELEGEISLKEFKARIPKAFNLTDYDKKISKTRPNEMMYEQRCRNLNCHRNFPKNMISYENQIFKRR